MKFLDEFRDPAAARRLLAEIATDCHAAVDVDGSVRRSDAFAAATWHRRGVGGGRGVDSRTGLPGVCHAARSDRLRVRVERPRRCAAGQFRRHVARAGKSRQLAGCPGCRRQRARRVLAAGRGESGPSASRATGRVLCRRLRNDHARHGAGGAARGRPGAGEFQFAGSPRARAAGHGGDRRGGRLSRARVSGSRACMHGDRLRRVRAACRIGIACRSL